MATATNQLALFPTGGFPKVAKSYPMMRYMGSKFRLLPWIHNVLMEIDFETVLDGFSGSGCVGYLLKAMGKKVHSADFLNFPTVLATALVENPGIILDAPDLERLLCYDPRHRRFIESTFEGIFYTTDDLRLLDRLSWNIRKFRNKYKRALATSALIRSCAKRQPRGVFTVAGDPEKYKDGRRDLKLSIREHFEENVATYNAAVFDNGRDNVASRTDIFGATNSVDLVYLDPPYVPRADDNCYMKRYHFLEGLSCYWDGVEIMETSRVKKIAKPYTPFSYRKSAADAFDRMFSHFKHSIIVLSYSSNGFPDLCELVAIMERYKRKVTVNQRDHRYHFGTHGSATRNEVTEYLVIGE
ncbi:MAG: DNA adenine methylase [Planctomycetales bacterium]|nr:DNA adenine methylase [Planctomycetales bacterium]